MIRSPSSRDSSGASYAGAGVDIEAGNALVEMIKPVVKATARSGSLGGLGGFGGLFDLSAAGYSDPLLVAATDGVGTKLKLAIDGGRHDTVGIDLVAMCVNDLIVQGAEPLFFLDYFATSALDPKQAAAVIAGIAAGCREAGCALIGGETAEMPGMYQPKDYDLAGFCVGAVERARLLPTPTIGEGDLLVGLPSSGLHSNGFSLVRKLIRDACLELTDPVPFAEDRVIDQVMIPTRIYVASVLHALRTCSPGTIKALSHITGGGLLENIPRVLPEGLAASLDFGALPRQPVFDWLRQLGDIDDQEMMRTFNCGCGMVLVIDASAHDAVNDALQSAGEQPFPLGEIVARDQAAIRTSGTIWD